MTKPNRVVDGYEFQHHGAPRTISRRTGVSLAQLAEYDRAGLRVCTVCAQPHELDQFAISPAHFGARESRCKPCKQGVDRAVWLVRRGERVRPKRGADACDYCGRGNALNTVRLEGKTWRVHADCKKRAREYVYGDPVRDPIEVEHG